MPTPVINSNINLVFDTIPALKVRHYISEHMCNNIYTYARMYVLNGALEFRLYSFQKKPPPETKVSFAVCAKPNCMLVYTLTPNNNGLLHLHCNKNNTKLNTEKPVYFGENDEQGWCWGAQSSFSCEQLAKAGILLDEGSEFSAAVFIKNAHTFGASYEMSSEKSFLNQSFFSKFIIVGY